MRLGGGRGSVVARAAGSVRDRSGRAGTGPAGGGGAATLVTVREATEEDAPALLTRGATAARRRPGRSSEPPTEDCCRLADLAASGPGAGRRRGGRRGGRHGRPEHAPVTPLHDGMAVRSPTSTCAASTAGAASGKALMAEAAAWAALAGRGPRRRGRAPERPGGEPLLRSPRSVPAARPAPRADHAAASAPRSGPGRRTARRSWRGLGQDCVARLRSAVVDPRARRSARGGGGQGAADAGLITARQPSGAHPPVGLVGDDDLVRRDRAAGVHRRARARHQPVARGAVVGGVDVDPDRDLPSGARAVRRRTSPASRRARTRRRRGAARTAGCCPRRASVRRRGPGPPP